MRQRYVIFALVLALVELIIALQTAGAHETWFIGKGEHAGEHFAMELTNLLVVLGAILLALSAFAIQRTSWFGNIDAFFEKTERLVPSGIRWRIVAILSGVMLIANAATGVFLAPDFVLPSDGLVVLGGVIQTVIGLLLVSQISFSLAGALIVAVAMPLAAICAPGSFLIDYFVEYLALALAFFFVGLSSICPDKLACRWINSDPGDSDHLPLLIIRAGLGLTLIVLSIHHKLANPDIALTFLDKYELNFIPYLGLTGFTNLHFVFAAGVTEVTFGLLLFVGIATRFVAAGLAVFLFTTLIILGPVELVGHLPLIGITLLLLSARDRIAWVSQIPEARWGGNVA